MTRSIRQSTDERNSGFVRVRGAREHNLKNVDLEIPRDALVVFTGISGSGKSSLAFGTLYAEAQRRYLESVAPYARRLFHQMGVPQFDEIEGLPPAVALQQQRGSPTTRSSVGSVTTLSNLLRMLFSRAGTYPRGQPHLEAEAFSTNTAEGACPDCHGLGQIYDVTEQSMVPDDSLSIRERAIAAWPPAWHGQNLRDIVVTLGYDIDRPWRELSKKGSQLAAVHRRAADRARLCRFRSRRSPKGAAAQGRAELSRNLHRRPAVRAAYLCHDAKPADEETGVAISDRQPLPEVSWQTAAARGPVGQVCRPGHRRNVEPAAEAVGRNLSSPMPTARPRAGPEPGGRASGAGDGRRADCPAIWMPGSRCCSSLAWVI